MRIIANTSGQRSRRPLFAAAGGSVALFVAAAVLFIAPDLMSYGQRVGAKAAVRQAAAAGTAADSAATPTCPEPPACPALDCSRCAGTLDNGGQVAGSGSAAKAAMTGDSWQSNPHVTMTDYTTNLTTRELQKGLVSHGSTARARRAVHKLLAGQPISVAVIGGSIAWGQGALEVGKTDFAALLFQWINATFPAARHKLVNGAIPGVPSSYFSLCHAWHVPEDADIVILEFNINDGGERGGHPLRRSHERLVRKLLGYRNRPAVLEMVFYRYPFPNFKDMDKIESAYRYMGDDEMGAVAQYYHLPWLSVRSMVWDYLPETAPDPSAGKRSKRFQELWRSIETEGDHPSNTGHRWMADMLIYWMQQVLEDVARAPLQPEDEEEAQAELSAPMWTGNWESTTNTCLMGEQVKDLVTAHDPAFQWINEGTDKKPKWGFISTTPGSSLHLTVKTSVVKNQAKDAQLWLAVGYLKSYEHMGKFQVVCEGGCACEPYVFDGLHHLKESQLYHGNMLVTASDACQLKFTVLNETSSGEHKFKLMGLVISEVAGWMLNEDQERGLSVRYEKSADGRSARWGSEKDEEDEKK